jgi:hypothetical protein
MTDAFFAGAIDVPEARIRLNLEIARAAPTKRGLYAAWIMSEAALGQAGIAAPAPRVVYIGVGNGRSGLRNRLQRHASDPFWDLVDLLAARGTVLPGWWQYAIKHQPLKRIVKPSPLANLTSRQVLAWQESNLRWGWDTTKDVAAHEARLIAEAQPVLNIKGRGFRALGPPYLRAIGAWEPARAAWFFSAVWIAVLCRQPDGWIRSLRLGRLHEIGVDHDGWPTPLAQSRRLVRLHIPSESQARKILSPLLPREISANPFNDDEEGRAWWAAYAGLQFRPSAQTPEEALSHALAQNVGSIRTPPKLPEHERRKALVSIVGQLPGVTH